MARNRKKGKDNGSYNLDMLQQLAEVQVVGIHEVNKNLEKLLARMTSLDNATTGKAGSGKPNKQTEVINKLYKNEEKWFKELVAGGKLRASLLRQLAHHTSLGIFGKSIFLDFWRSTRSLIGDILGTFVIATTERISKEIAAVTEVMRAGAAVGMSQQESLIRLQKDIPAFGMLNAQEKMAQELEFMNMGFVGNNFLTKEFVGLARIQGSDTRNMVKLLATTRDLMQYNDTQNLNLLEDMFELNRNANLGANLNLMVDLMGKIVGQTAAFTPALSPEQESALQKAIGQVAVAGGPVGAEQLRRFTDQLLKNINLQVAMGVDVNRLVSTNSQEIAETLRKMIGAANNLVERFTITGDIRSTALARQNLMQVTGGVDLFEFFRVGRKALATTIEVAPDRQMGELTDALKRSLLFTDPERLGNQVASQIGQAIAVGLRDIQNLLGSMDNKLGNININSRYDEQLNLSRQKVKESR